MLAPLGGRHADGTVERWLFAHEVGERNNHHHINGVLVVRSNATDEEKIKYARIMIKNICERCASVRGPPHALARTSLLSMPSSSQSAHLRRTRRP